jgi:hypothetical protein
VTGSQGNATNGVNATHLLDGCPWKNTHDWVSALPPLLNGRGAEDKVATRVLLNLSSKADHKTGRNAYPSNSWLAARCHVSERSVRSALQRLEEAKRIERDGLSRHGTVKWRMRFEFDVPAGWLPLDARDDHKRALAAERQRRRRAKLISEAKCVTDDENSSSEQQEAPEAKCVTGPVDLGSQVRDVTQPASDNQSFQPPVKETSQQTSDAAAASPAEDVIDAELVDDELPGPEGPPLLSIAPPPAELVPAATSLPAVPDLSASWLLSEPEETGKRKRKAPVDAPRFDAEAWQLPREPRTPSAWVRELVARYVDACRQCGFEPSGRQIGQVGKEVRGLVAAGNNPVHILAAVRRAAEKRGAWVQRGMADVQPGNWSAQRPGRQIVTPQGVQQLPQGVGAAEARYLSIMAFAKS